MSAAISAEGIPRRILGAWQAGFFRMYVSYDLLHELESVLLRPYFLDRLTYSDVLAYVQWIGDGGDLADLPEDAEDERVSTDPDDDYLVNLALVYDADYLVSGDRHLLQIEDERIRVLSPRAFWDGVLVPRL